MRLADLAWRDEKSSGFIFDKVKCELSTKGPNESVCGLCLNNLVSFSDKISYSKTLHRNKCP